jgi:hypothetical protein
MKNNFKQWAHDQVGAMLGAFRFRADGGFKAEKPKVGEESAQQSPLYNRAALPAGGLAATMYQGAGGMPAFLGLWQTAFPGCPFNFAGAWLNWTNSADPIQRRGGYVPYRLMSLDPTLKLVYTLISAPILSSQWTIGPRKGVTLDENARSIVRDGLGRVVAIPRVWADAVGDMVLPLRRGILQESLRYMASGWRPFERVYEKRDGLMWLKKLKPLLPDWTDIIDAGAGNFGGVNTNGASLDARKSWICSNDVEAGNLYGLSRHEAAFDAWMDKQYARVRAALLTAKLAGVLPIVYYKPGLTPMGNDQVDNTDIAKKIVATLFNGVGVCVPTTEYSDSDLQENPKLAGLSPWKIDIVNAGSYAPAIDGIIRERQYQDVQMCRAWGVPERAALEATSAGSRADSESHGDSASFDLEAIDDDIADQFSRGQPTYDVPGVIDEIVALNWGESARGLLRAIPAPLVDSKVEVYEKLLQSVFGNPQMASTFASVVDWPDVLSHLDIATTDDLRERLPELLRTAADQQQQQASAQTEATKAAVEGGGRLKGLIANGKERISRINGDE